MALENLTKITSVGISSHIALTGVTTVGFITSADAWVGGALTVGGNITIGGTVTYEDVTNIDSVGIITSQNGLRVTAGGINVTAGVSTYSGLVDVNNRIDVVGGANIDQANITGILTATTLIGALTTTDACQTGDLTILNGNPDLRLKDSNHGGNNTEHIITFQDSSGNNQMNIGSPFGEQHLRIKHGTTDLLKIQTDGKVGINTTDPTEILDVRGNLVVVDGNLVVAKTLAVNRPRIVLSAPNDGSTYRHLFGANLQVNNSGTYTTPTANISGGGWEYFPANNLNAHGSLVYQSAPDTNATSSTPVERLRIDPDGHVGIGTDAPAGGSSLHINGSGASDKNHIRLTADRGLIARLGDTSGSAQSMFDLYGTDGSTQILRFISGGGDNWINTGGNLGIGTVSPSGVVEAYSASSKINVITIRTGAGANGYAGLAFASNTTHAREKAAIYFQETSAGAHHKGDIVFAVDSAGGDAGQVATSDEKVRITSAGHIGIGSDAPSIELDILNTSSSADLRLKTTANSFNSFIFDSNRSADTQFAIIDGRWNGNIVNRIQFVTGSDGTNKDDGYMAFHTRQSGESLEERLRITSDGKIGIGTQIPAADLHIETSAGGEIVLSDSDAVRKNGIRCASSDNICIYADANSEGGSSFIKFEVDGSDRGRFDSNGNLRIEDGDLQINTAGHGIDFSATSDGGTLGSELLDDYEEGTYTPLMYGHTTGTGSDTLSGNGYYTKVGNVVTTTLVFSNKNGNTLPASEQLRISGLPFNAHASAGNQNTGSPFTYNVNFDPSESQVFICAGNNNYLRGYRNRDTATWQPWATNDWRQSQIYLYLSITYLSTV